jgi:NhaP-type Na+/H+ or K+/H+ antiporter
MSVEATLVVLFSVATAVAIGARWVLLAFILPGLLFEAAYNLDLAELRRTWWGITAFAEPAVVVAIALTAWITSATIGALGIDPRFTMGLGLAFGALMAATDPVAVVALFKQLRAPARLTTLLAAESLLNDGTAIVFPTLILATVSSGMICGSYGKQGRDVGRHQSGDSRFLGVPLVRAELHRIPPDRLRGGVREPRRGVARGGIAYVAARVSRAAVSAEVTMLLRRSVQRITVGWSVVLNSLVPQGLSMPWLLRRLRISDKGVSAGR